MANYKESSALKRYQRPYCSPKQILLMCLRNEGTGGTNDATILMPFRFSVWLSTKIGGERDPKCS